MERPKDQSIKPSGKYCNARKKKSGGYGYCRQVAGYGTDHVGTGRCKFHGGSSSGRPPIHGRYSNVRKALNDKYQHFLTDPNPVNLNDEIALLRALVHQHLDEHEDAAGDEGTIAINQLINLISELTKVSERQSRIIQRQAVTMKELISLSQGLQLLIVDLAKEYVIGDKRKEFTTAFTTGFRNIIGGAASAARSGTIGSDDGDGQRQVDLLPG